MENEKNLNGLGRVRKSSKRGKFSTEQTDKNLNKVNSRKKQMSSLSFILLQELQYCD